MDILGENGGLVSANGGRKRQVKTGGLRGARTRSARVSQKKGKRKRHGPERKSLDVLPTNRGPHNNIGGKGK